MKTISTVFLIALFFISPLVKAQEEEEVKKKLPFEIGADLMSRYVWRGQCLDKSPNIQPYLIYAPAFGLQVGAWGSYSFSGDFAEVDLFLAYSYAGFTISLTDYFEMDESMEINNFFDYNKDNTGHILEGALIYDGPENVPLTLTLATMFYGADQKLDHVVIDTTLNDTTAYYANQFSTYFEVAYSVRNLSFFVGLTPAAGFYGDKFGIVNVGISAEKEIKITKNYAIPLKAALIANPQKENIFLVFGMSF